MKEIYLDVMEKSLSAYTLERINNYIKEVKVGGLKEHVFPRLGVNIGILIANGRRTELTDIFIQIMNICCAEMPEVKAQNDFSVREVCCLLMLLEKTKAVDIKLVNKWKEQIAQFNPWEKYNSVAESPNKPSGNWAAFESRLSEESVVIEEYGVSNKGMDIMLSGEGDIGFMLPVLDFAGFSRNC